MPRIVVVEDQPSLQKSLKRGLEEEAFEVLTASSGREAYGIISREPCDGVILDLMLPDGDGLSLLQRLREEEFNKPVLIVTARDSIPDRIKGLECGADDYVLKPFDFSELLARLRAVLRRSVGTNADTKLSYRDLQVDCLSRVAVRDGKQLSLTKRQFELLEYLLQHKNQIVTRESLARDVWKASTATWTNVIEVQINQLRKKLCGPCQEPLLHTIRGEGYLLGDEP